MSFNWIKIKLNEKLLSLMYYSVLTSSTFNVSNHHGRLLAFSLSGFSVYYKSFCKQQNGYDRLLSLIDHVSIITIGGVWTLAPIPAGIRNRHISNIYSYMMDTCWFHRIKSFTLHTCITFLCLHWIKVAYVFLYSWSICNLLHYCLYF